MYLFFFNLTGKTRTKDKYRVVYTDYQRLELEKEYHMSRYITIRRKSELAQSLQLSERQVKIWFQNRRAKERKQTKKRDDPTNGSGISSGPNTPAGLSLQHHNMNSSASMNLVNGLNGLDIKPKIEPSLLSHNLHNFHHAHHQHAMHQQYIHNLHLHQYQTPAAPPPPPPLSSPVTSSVTSSSLHQQHSSMTS